MHKTVLVVGLAVAAVGIFIQYLTGVPGFPTVPPGPIILGVAALLVAFCRWRYISYVGVGAALFVFLGAIAAFVVKGTSANLVFPGPIIGTSMQILGLIAALIYGVEMIRRRIRVSRPSKE